MPAYKRRVWDGKIRLFARQTGELPAGLIHHLVQFSRSRDYKIESVKTNYGIPYEEDKIDGGDITSFCESIGLPYNARDYQRMAVKHGLEKKRAILLSPTGSGKSLIIYMLMRYILEAQRNNILIIVPTTSLVEQLYGDFEEYGYDVESHCHRIYSGKDKITDKRIIISTWQSIYKLPKIWFEQFGAIFGDECHGFKSKSLMTIMNKATEAEYRYGTTGTLDGTQTHELVLQGLFGRTFKVTTTKELQDNDTLAKLSIQRLELQYPPRLCKEFDTERSYADEIEFIVTLERRNRFIRNLALDQNGNTLVLYNYVEKHGKPLFDMIEDKANEDRKVFFVSGGTDTSDREAIRGIVERMQDAIIVASLGTFSTGINIRNLHNIIFASPSKSQIRVLQSIGRGLRKSDDGRKTTLYDLSDNFTGKNFSLLHSFERLKIYKNEKFDYKTYKVQL